MYSYLFVTIISILLPALFYKGKSGIGLKLSFIILTLFIGLRYNYGNDTKTYMDLFYQINDFQIGIFNFGELIDALPCEPGWFFINNLFGIFGWYFFQFIVAAFECYVLYDFINTYVPKRFQWLSVAIFTLSSPFMFIGACSMMRQWLACMIFVFSLRYLKRQKFVPFLICFFASVTMHKSAVVLLPFSLFYFAKKDILVSKVSIMVTVFLLLVWYTASKEVVPYLDVLLTESNSLTSYSIYKEAADTLSFTIIGFFAVFLMPVFSISQLKKHERENVILIYISLVSLLFLPMQTYSIMIGRLSVYFSAITIVVYPMLLSKLPNNRKYNYLVLLLILIILLPAVKDLLECFSSPTYKDYYDTYHTFIFS